MLAQAEGRAIQKSISPASSVRPQPGLPGQNIQVKFAVQNTGTLWLKQLVVQDTDAAFFDAVDVRPADPGEFPTQRQPGPGGRLHRRCGPR